MTTAITEADFQSTVVDLAHLHGWRAMHVRRATAQQGTRWLTPTTVEGWPDLVLWKPNRLLFRELKSDSGRLTASQAEVLASLVHAGADVAVWRPRDWDVIETELRADR